jgi:hypothetical protein
MEKEMETCLPLDPEVYAFIMKVSVGIEGDVGSCLYEIAIFLSLQQRFPQLPLHPVDQRTVNGSAARKSISS